MSHHLPPAGLPGPTGLSRPSLARRAAADQRLYASRPARAEVIKQLLDGVSTCRQADGHRVSRDRRRRPHHGEPVISARDRCSCALVNRSSTSCEGPGWSTSFHWPEVGEVDAAIRRIDSARTTISASASSLRRQLCRSTAFSGSSRLPRRKTVADRHRSGSRAATARRGAVCSDLAPVAELLDYTKFSGSTSREFVLAWGPMGNRRVRSARIST